MDTVNLRQELDLLATDFQLKSRAGEPLEDLLPRARGLEASARHLNIPDFIAVSLMRRAEILAGLQRPAEVVSVLEQARGVLGDWRQQDLGVRVLALLAEARAQLKEWKIVSELCEQGIELAERFRYKVSSQYLQSAYLRSRIGLYALGVRAAYELGDLELMLARAELSKCRSLLSPRSGKSEESVSDAEAQFQLACRQVDEARARGRDPAPLLVKRRQLWDLVVIERRAREGRKWPEFSLRSVQAVLGADETILYYYWVSAELLLIVLLERESVRMELKTVPAEQRKGAETFANALLGFRQDNRGLMEEAVAFGEWLIPGAAARQWAGKRRLLISPHRLLHALPFHAMRWQGDFLLRRLAITYIPNLTSLLEAWKPAPAANVSLWGASEYHVPGYENQLPALPQAEQEVASIAECWRSAGATVSLFQGKEACEERWRALLAQRKLEGVSLLHFALHGENVSADTPMESHLFLRDSLLDGLEVAHARLEADLVVLSACCAGQRAIAGRGLAELPGDEMFGLSAAFFAAGARQVFGTLWPVESHAAVPITGALHRHLAAGQTADIAWQQAVSEYLQRAGVLKRKLYYWAPFFLCAAGRREGAAGGQ